MSNYRAIPISALNEVLVLDKNSGLLFWKLRCEKVFGPQAKQFNGRFAGKEAFTAVNSHGYKKGTLTFKAPPAQVFAHTVIWAMVSGAWPDEGKEIDHINGIRSDNRPENLRMVETKENQRNKRRSKRNKTGINGISVCPKTGSFIGRIAPHYERRFPKHFTIERVARTLAMVRGMVGGYHPNHGSEPEQGTRCR